MENTGDETDLSRAQNLLHVDYASRTERGAIYLAQNITLRNIATAIMVIVQNEMFPETTQSPLSYRQVTEESVSNGFVHIRILDRLYDMMSSFFWLPVLENISFYSRAVNMIIRHKVVLFLILKPSEDTLVEKCLDVGPLQPESSAFLGGKYPSNLYHCCQAHQK